MMEKIKAIWAKLVEWAKEFIAWVKTLFAKKKI